MEIKILIWEKIASPGLVFSFKRMSKTQNRMLEEEDEYSRGAGFLVQKRQDRGDSKDGERGEVTLSFPVSGIR